MLKVNEFNQDIFPNKFLEYLPKKCEVCNSDMEISEALTRLQCSNRRCPAKVANRIYNLLCDIGILNITEDECMKFVQKFKLKNSYAILLYNPLKDGELYEMYGENNSMQLYKRINQRRRMLLWEYLKIGNIEGLKYNAKILLQDFTNLDDFYKAIKEKGIMYIQNLLVNYSEIQISQDVLLVDAVTLYDALLTFEKDIKQGVKGIVIQESKNQIGVLFNTNVQGYTCNYDYLLKLNNIYKDKIYFYEILTIPEKDNFVVYSEEESNLSTDTTLLKDVKAKYPDIKVVNKSTKFDTLEEK